MQFDTIVGILARGLGINQGPLRVDKGSSLVVADGRGRYAEMVAQSQVFSAVLSATSGTIAAGNIVAAAAAASTQFGLINPLGSGVNLEILKFGMGVISGTPAAGPVFHGYITNISSLTATPAGTARSNMMGQVGSAALVWSSAAGSALTGSTQAPVVQRAADFAATATAQAVANGHVRAIEEVAGELIIPPNTMWLPLWSGAGTTLLNGYSITWAEVPA
jgi:hypothetical protein